MRHLSADLRGTSALIGTIEQGQDKSVSAIAGSDAVRATMASIDSFRRFAKRLIMSQVFKALSDPTRRHVLQLLRKGPMSAGELSEHFNVSKPTMSAHFAVLKEADLIHARKAGKSVIYHLKLSVLEETLLSFIDSFGLNAEAQPKREDVR